MLDDYISNVRPHGVASYEFNCSGHELMTIVLDKKEPKGKINKSQKRLIHTMLCFS